MNGSSIYEDINQYQISYQKKFLAYLSQKLKKALSKFYKQGLFEGQNKISNTVNNIEKIVKGTNSYKNQLIKEVAENLIKEKILNNPNQVVNMAINLLKNISEHSRVLILAHPNDRKILEQSMSIILLACSRAKEIRIKDDFTLSLGSLIIMANKSILDAQIKTQLNCAFSLLESNREEL